MPQQSGKEARTKVKNVRTYESFHIHIPVAFSLQKKAASHGKKVWEQFMQQRH
jgi:hypothetical protein